MYPCKISSSDHLWKNLLLLFACFKVSPKTRMKHQFSKSVSPFWMSVDTFSNNLKLVCGYSQTKRASFTCFVYLFTSPDTVSTLSLRETKTAASESQIQTPLIVRQKSSSLWRNNRNHKCFQCTKKHWNVWKYIICTHKKWWITWSLDSFWMGLHHYRQCTGL